MRLVDIQVAPCHCRRRDGAARLSLALTCVSRHPLPLLLPGLAGIAPIERTGNYAFDFRLGYPGSVFSDMPWTRRNHCLNGDDEGPFYKSRSNRAGKEGSTEVVWDRKRRGRNVRARTGEVGWRTRGSQEKRSGVEDKRKGGTKRGGSASWEERSKKDRRDHQVGGHMIRPPPPHPKAERTGLRLGGSGLAGKGRPNGDHL